MSINDELDFSSELPFMVRVVRGINSSIWILISNPSAALIYGIVYIIFLISLLTSKIRNFANNSVFGILIIIFSGVIILLYYSILGRNKWDFILKMYLGGPVYGELGGPRRKTFFTSLKCANEIEYKIKEEDKELMKTFTELDREVTKEVLKNRYYEYLDDSDIDIESKEFNDKWMKTWDEILDIQTEGITLREALINGTVTTFLLNYLEIALRTITVSSRIFQLIMLFSIIRYLNGAYSLISVIQIGIFFIFLYTVIYFIHHVNFLYEINLLEVPQLPAEVENKLADKLSRARELFPAKIYPFEIKVKERYYSIVRDYVFLSILVESCINIIGFSLIIGLSIITGRIYLPNYAIQTFSFYKNLFFGSLVIIPGFTIGYYMFFNILKSRTKFIKTTSPIITGLSSAIIPYALDYLVTGKVDITNLQTAAYAGLSAAFVTISTTLTSQIKEKIEEL